MSKKIQPLVSLSVIVLLSLVIAVVLFGILSSTGIVKSRYAEFGGAASGFFVALYLLQHWYVGMEAIQNENKQLQETLDRKTKEFQQTLVRRKGKVTVPLEFRLVSKDHPRPGLEIDPVMTALDVKGKYEIHSEGKMVDKGGVTLSNSSVIAPAPETQGDSLVLIFTEKNSSRTWETRPFHIKTETVIARHIMPISSPDNRLSNQVAIGADVNDN